MGRARPGLKSLEDAEEIRRRVLSAFERSERETEFPAHPYVRDRGAPPRTGVRWSGALAETALNAAQCAGIFAHRPPGIHVMLLEGGPRILPAIRPKLANAPGSHCAVSAWGSEIHPGDRHARGCLRRWVDHPDRAVVWAAATSPAHYSFSASAGRTPGTGTGARYAAFLVTPRSFCPGERTAPPRTRHTKRRSPYLPVAIRWTVRGACHQWSISRPHSPPLAMGQKVSTL